MSDLVRQKLVWSVYPQDDRWVAEVVISYPGLDDMTFRKTFPTREEAETAKQGLREKVLLLHARMREAN